MNNGTYTYYVYSRETGELVCSGTSGYCSDYLGCERSTVIVLSKREQKNHGFFNSRYRVEREPRQVTKEKAMREALLRIEKNTHGGNA